MQSIITVENLGKRYRLGTQGAAYATVREALTNALVSRRRAAQGKGNRLPESIWALRDVSFQIKPGEVVGIIGRNGAGKSTLLKILSRITEPTTGRVVLRGRVGSLLEVGTGFHSELTGRENIFLNGSILGMSRKEILGRFDQIVAFAEVEQFIDTPVKRYSSGMYLRLAFAVAAHLEPEILVVDEVLAVGDVAFQKKCLGKMGDVAKQGRTVLFVSHHLQSIKTLCPRTILIEAGGIKFDGPTNDALEAYKQLLRQPKVFTNQSLKDRMDRTSGAVRFTSAAGIAEDGSETWDFKMGSTIRLRLGYQVFGEAPSLGIYLALRSTLTNEVITSFKEVASEGPLHPGDSSILTIEIPDSYIRPGEYSLYICLGNRNCEKFFDVIDENVDLPWIRIYSDEKDPHRLQGYFTVPVRLRVG
ncbi:MAG TPA: polysaccharide ABC transporter ATP-binding protein [Pyrinomonadaceae bacterium]|nr:polysaccharide ABC transporter ATP-binding protein [Pyrinomonadaceae bacterium]